VSETIRSAAGQRVRDTIVRADRTRRRRSATVWLWRAAPLVAAASLSVAVAGRMLHWSPALPLTFLAAGLASLVFYVIVNGRARPLSDRIAAAIDADASCGGELRSASWFAARQDHNPWTDLHVNRAADRLETIDWSNLYPPVRAVRAWVMTAVLVAATLVAAFVFPQRSAVRANTPVASDEPHLPASLDQLPPELLQQLAELLDAAENGTPGAERTSLTPAQLRELIASLSKLKDRQALKELAQKLEANRNAGTQRSDQQMKALSERAKHAALNVESREAREAMENLARSLDEAAAEEAVSEQNRSLASADKSEPGEGAQAASAAAIDEASIQSVKEAAPSATGAGVVTSSKDAAAGAATPGFGVGGSGANGAEGRPTELANALRQEVVEANTDNTGDNVNAPVRRRTEEGHASATFTNSASGKSDRSRATAPPEVPESRRTDVQRYFTRKQ
jgi:hypothetical protein